MVKKVNSHKEALETWKAKLKKLNVLQHNLHKEPEEIPEEKKTDSSEEE